MTAVLLAGLAAVGTYLLFSAVAFGSRTLRAAGLGPPDAPRSKRLLRWLAEAGLADFEPRELSAVIVGPFVVVALLAYGAFGALLPALAAGALASVMPLGAARRRRMARIVAARDAWPRMIEEIRVLTGSLGRSIPQALFEVGRRAPIELQPAFDAAHREWLLSTDFDRTVRVLKSLLADPTADATLETLAVAHGLGGSSLDRRLEALAEDRQIDVQGRNDARARQAGVRFARRFVIIVPLGMAVVGLQIGDGRAAYRTSAGQLAMLAALGCVTACWTWSTHLLRLPSEQRVFDK